jgi:hypothetical protein
MIDGVEEVLVAPAQPEGDASSAASRVWTLVPRRAQSKTAKQETQEL